MNEKEKARRGRALIVLKTWTLPNEGLSPEGRAAAADFLELVFCQAREARWEL